MNNIINILPNRHPFILVDKILKIEKKKIFTLKNFSNNEEYIKNHFEYKYIVPGTIILENIAQTSSIFIHYKYKINLFKNSCYLVLIEKVKFNFLVYPGDQLITKSYLKNKKKNFVKFKIFSFIKNKILISTNIILKIND